MKNISNILIIAVSIIIVGYVVYTFSDIVAYVLIAWVIALVGEPLMRLYSKIRIGRFSPGATIRAIMTLISIILILATLTWIFIPLVVEQARNLSEVDSTEIARALSEPAQQLEIFLHKYGVIEADFSFEKDLPNMMTGWFDPARISTFFSTIVGLAGNILIGIFSVLFIAFFFLREERLFSNFIVSIVPSKYEERTLHAIEESKRLLIRYFGGIMIQVTVITVFVSLLLTLLGVKNGLLIGFFAALINVIPYLGPTLGAIFGIFITISSNLGLDFYTGMLPLIGKVIFVFALVQMLDNFLIQPYIFSNSVLAHPLEIFIVILVGSQIGGVLGMILAIPTYTVIRVIARAFLSEFRIVQMLTGGMSRRENRS